MRCPGCGCALHVELEAVSMPSAERQRPRPIAELAELTGEPVGRLKRWARSGQLRTVRGPRSAYLASVEAVEAIRANYPPAQPVATSRHNEPVDEIERLRLVSGGGG